MFCEEISTKEDLSYISINMYSLSILYNGKFILMAASLGTNAVVVMRVQCKLLNYSIFSDFLRDFDQVSAKTCFLKLNILRYALYSGPFPLTFTTLRGPFSRQQI